MKVPKSGCRSARSSSRGSIGVASGARVVRLWIENSDFEIKYVFKKTAACWELTRVEDGAV